MKLQLTSKDVKEIALKLGADLCGIASSRSFDHAPKGFKPNDIYKQCKSVVTYAKRLPSNIMYSSSCIPYTKVMSRLMDEIDSLGIELSMKLEDYGVYSMLIPANAPYEYWDSDKSLGKGILSQKHAAQLAGLGIIGRNTLLVNEKYGNMLVLGSILVDNHLEPDLKANSTYCPPKCRLCIDSCPVGALDGKTVNQASCRSKSGGKSLKGHPLKTCFICRKVCPNMLGVKSSTL
ncbi:epoxyqueuosine reductase [Sporosalibacterium faouarense]|uniref:epoxyqueuosine reductase n=1 Tax=Sporosalibacterium faouarense TaxID=516123 RepID=UPI00192ADE6E|nr:epoxyqueuosine reductase [Sporosalibacterium faouarense]